MPMMSQYGYLRPTAVPDDMYVCWNLPRPYTNTFPKCGRNMIEGSHAQSIFAEIIRKEMKAQGLMSFRGSAPKGKMGSVSERNRRKPYEIDIDIEIGSARSGRSSNRSGRSDRYSVMSSRGSQRSHRNKAIQVAYSARKSGGMKYDPYYTMKLDTSSNLDYMQASKKIGSYNLEKHPKTYFERHDGKGK